MTVLVSWPQLQTTDRLQTDYSIWTYRAAERLIIRLDGWKTYYWVKQMSGLSNKLCEWAWRLRPYPQPNTKLQSHKLWKFIVIIPIISPTGYCNHKVITLWEELKEQTNNLVIDSALEVQLDFCFFTTLNAIKWPNESMREIDMFNNEVQSGFVPQYFRNSYSAS